jgi:hypothetical protein
MSQRNTNERWIRVCDLQSLLKFEGEVVGVSLRGDGEDAEVGFKFTRDTPGDE